MSDALTVVMYHYIRPLERTRFPEIKGLTVEKFRGQLAHIKSRYDVITMETAIAVAAGEERLPPDACLLTFDDGYLDHYAYAFPLLMEAGLTGAFYPPRSTALGRRVLDVNKVHFILAAVPDKEALARDMETLMEGARDRYAFPSRDALHAEYAKPNRWDTATVIYIKRLLQHALPDALRAEITQSLFSRHVAADETAFAEELYMSVEQMRVMHGCGMHFGGHGDDHHWLSRRTAEAQSAEIDGAADLLDRIGMAADQRTFCYPYGDYSDVTIDLLAAKSWRLAFTSVPGAAELTGGKPFQLPRLDTNDLPFSVEAAAA
jgi:peptidoglycan/xylan/chitin deacetylase (PgdA/CDA1 family)